ncbi:MAG: hypothetical protein JXB48_17540, partial [Candidatus Latescibacteria bacterium]|nr:hypothetical protein [Candidatus Latescibacterota bacterium]
MSLDKESPGHDRNDHRGNMLFSPIKDTSLLSRRQFVNIAATTMGGMFTVDSHSGFLPKSSTLNALENTMTNESDISMIGQYGPWAASLSGRRLPSHSYRRKKWSDLEKWRT